MSGTLALRLLRWGPCLIVLSSTLAALAMGQTTHAGPVESSDPQQIYLRDCAFCHGAHGEGGAHGPSLIDAGTAIVDYELSTGRMPLPSAGADVVRRPPKYDPQTIAALVAYVDDFQPGGLAVPQIDVATADLTKGGEDFRSSCAACHQAAGEGGALRFAEAPSLSRSTAQQVAEAMRTGPGTMPVFGPEEFTDAQVAGIARYVEYLHHPADPGGEPLWHLGPLAEGMVAFVVAVGLALALVAIGERR